MKIIIILYLVLFFILVVSGYNDKKPSVIFVDSTSKCTCNCGSFYSPFSNLKDAINYAGDNDNHGWEWHDWKYNDDCNDEFPVILVNPGIYIGEKNKDLKIDYNIQLYSLGGSSKTFIDCQYFGHAISVQSSNFFTLKGFTISNCHANFGGALNLTNSISIIDDIIFYNNNASYGGAISTFKSTTTITNCKFNNNIALEYGGAISVDGTDSITRIESSIFNCNANNNSKYDILASSSAIVSIDQDSNISTTGIFCKSLGSVSQEEQDKCNITSKCIVTGGGNNNGTGGNNSTDPNNGITFTCNNDGNCNLKYENCLSCPSDCKKCKFEGFKLISYTGLINSLVDPNSLIYPSTVQQLQSPQVLNFMDDKPCPVSGHLSAYLKVSLTESYEFRLTAYNLGARLYFNGVPQIDQYFQQSFIQTIRTVKISSEHSNRIDVLFFSTSSNERNLTVEWRKYNSNDENSEWKFVRGFYSMNTCNDGILDPDEKLPESPYYCPIDIKSQFSSNITEYRCGDGICNEVPETCIIDCYQIISESCPGKTPTQSIPHLPPTDTIGKLLNNQFLFSLPGIHHLRHGVDFLTSKQKTSLLFSFDYCDNSSYSTIQDFYRGLVYTIPKELFATMSPHCNFETKSEIASKASDFSENMATSSGISASASLGGGTSFIQASVSMAFSEEESVQKSRELSRSESGELVKTEINCQSSKVHFNSFKFSQSFLKDISNMTTIEQCKNVIQKYGSFYYKSATLGGTLQQITVIKSSNQKSYSSNDIQKLTERSMEASVSSKIFSVNVGYAQSTDSQTSSSDQEEFIENSKRSNLLIKGGPAGMFTPGDSSGGFNDWAGSIDTRPVPISFQLGYISDIIPSTWKVFNKDKTIKQLWIETEDSLLNDYIWDSDDIIVKRNVSRENTYLTFNFPSDQLYNGEVLLRISKVIEGEVKQLTISLTINSTTNTQEFEVQSINEILSIQLNTVGQNLVNKYSFIEIQDYSGNRVYQFSNIQISNITTPRANTDQVLLSFQITSGSINDYHYLEIGILGEIKLHQQIFRFNDASFDNLNNVVLPIQTNGFIGRVVNINLKYWGKTGNGLTFNNIKIYQTCPPIPDSSGCTPSSSISQQYGFVRSYSNKNSIKLTSYKQIKLPVA